MTAPTTDRARILGIAGSLRRLSFNKALLRAAVELAPDDVEITTFDRLRDIPHYDQDLDTADAPEAATALRDAIRAADALLLVTPEYNYSIPGTLKNAIDWASRPAATSPLRGKPTGLMGASTGISGTVRAQLALRQCFVFTQTYALQAPEVVVAKCADRFDADLRLTDEPTREVVRVYLERLRDWARTIGRNG